MPVAQKAWAVVLVGLVIFIVVQGIFNYATENPFTFWFMVGSPVALIAAFVIQDNKKKAARFATTPDHGPMQVELEEDHTRQGRFACGLVIDVKISKSDWKRIQDAGLMQHVFFSSPGPTGDVNDPDNVRHFQVKHLDQRCYIGFRHIIEMQEAKEKLIIGLHALRSQIEGHREGPRKESYEI